jgi:hypothetical protein
MDPKPAVAQILDFETTLDASPVQSADGEVIWADVRIEYLLSGLKPTVTIRLPIPWREQDAPQERRAQALRCARQLIDHACRAAGVPAMEPVIGHYIDDPSEVGISALEGLAQELGLSAPTTKSHS